MIPGVRSWRFRLAVMWALRCRRPTLPCFSLPVPVTLIRFLTLLLVLFLVAMCSLRAGERGGRPVLKSPRHSGKNPGTDPAARWHARNETPGGWADAAIP